MGGKQLRLDVAETVAMGIGSSIAAPPFRSWEFVLQPKQVWGNSPFGLNLSPSLCSTTFDQRCIERDSPARCQPTHRVHCEHHPEPLRAEEWGVRQQCLQARVLQHGVSVPSCVQAGPRALASAGASSIYLLYAEQGVHRQTYLAPQTAWAQK